MANPPKKPQDGDDDDTDGGRPASAASDDATEPGAVDVLLSPRAREIRDMIEAGTYDVDLDDLADALAGSGDLERVGPDTTRAPANDERPDD